MKKRCKNANKGLRIIAISVILFATILSGGCVKTKAYESEVNERIDGAIDDFYDAVPEGAPDINGVTDVSESLGVKHILAEVIAAIRDGSDELVALTLTLLGIALICTLASLSDGELSPYATGAVCAVSAALLFERLIFLAKGTVSALSEINSFFGAVIPISLAVNSLGASPTTASTQAVGMGLTLSAYSFITERMLGGVTGAIFISSALSSLDPAFSRIARSVKTLFTWMLGIVTLLLGATFALQSTISASADSIAMRGAKYAVSSAIPIVGGAVSGALGLVSGGIAYARGIVGGGAIAVLLSLVISPLVTLLAYRFCLKLGVTFCSFCSIDSCERIFSAFSGAIDALIAVYALSAAIYLTELAAFLKGGANLA